MLLASVGRADWPSVQERREIEKALFNGDILGVAATNALELGVDVGGLDMTMHLGFQGEIGFVAVPAPFLPRVTAVPLLDCLMQADHSMQFKWFIKVTRHYGPYPCLKGLPTLEGELESEEKKLQSKELVAWTGERPIYGKQDM